MDAGVARDVWVAIEATVTSRTSVLGDGDGGAVDDAAHPTTTTTSCGAITSLRLCYKPLQGCRVRHVVGQRGRRDLTHGQRCTLFLQLHVPRAVAVADADALFTELESILGALAADVLHVEARYRHALLPATHLVAVRHVCRIARPQTGSRWSLAPPSPSSSTSLAPASSSAADGNTDAHDPRLRLAHHLAASLPPPQALQLLHQLLDAASRALPAVRAVQATLHAHLPSDDAQQQQQLHPAVIVTETETESESESDPVAACPAPHSPAATVTVAPSPQRTHSLPIPVPGPVPGCTLAPPSPPPPPRPAPVSVSVSAAAAASASVPQDSARQVWHHIRRASMSLDAATAEQLRSIEAGDAGDETLRALRDTALLNKRSVGAETLRAWKWEQGVAERGRAYGYGWGGEAPWM